MSDWRYVGDEMPRKGAVVYIHAIFENGNGTGGLSSWDGKKWDLENIGDYPEQEDVMYWIALPDDPLPLRKDSQLARAAHAVRMPKR